MGAQCTISEQLPCTGQLSRKTACAWADFKKEPTCDAEDYAGKDLTDSLVKAIPVVVDERARVRDPGGSSGISKPSPSFEPCDHEHLYESHPSVCNDNASGTTVDDQFSDVVSTIPAKTNDYNDNDDNDTDCGESVVSISKDSLIASEGGTEVLEPCRRRDMRRSTTGKMLQCVRSTATQVAVENPDDINNVYNFTKQTLAHGGNMGMVKKATGKVTGAVRAVKFVPKSLAKEKMSSVKARIEVMTTFDHPNLVSLHEIFSDDNYVYLVMDYCQGGSLHQTLQKATISEVQAAIVMQQVLRAVFYMHGQLICHRDLRPQNILFTSAGDISASCSVKVCGFGTACFMRRGEVFRKVVGEFGYMAPEISSGSYGKACDLWSCGVVLFQMLCGRLPFPLGAASDDKASRKFKREDILFLPQDANLSGSARELITLLLEPDPRARYNADQALHHKWIQKAVPKLTSMPVSAAVIESLKAYRALGKFEQAAYRIVASLLSDDEKANERRLFLFLDGDGDGKITPAEIEKQLASGSKLAKAYPDVSEVFRHVDHTGRAKKKHFSYTEFVAATFDRQKCLTEQVCRVAFRCFDKNGDGSISISELSVGYLLGELSLEELGTTFESLDANGDANIDFEEFMAMMRKKR